MKSIVFPFVKYTEHRPVYFDENSNFPINAISETGKTARQFHPVCIVKITAEVFLDNETIHTPSQPTVKMYVCDRKGIAYIGILEDGLLTFHREDGKGMDFILVPRGHGEEYHARGSYRKHFKPGKGAKVRGDYDHRETL